MADLICGECSSAYVNSGIDRCAVSPQIIRHIVFVPLYDSAGNKNELDLSTLDENTIPDLLNESDRTKRWYPLREVDNFESEREDPSTEDLESGVPLFLREGNRPFTVVKKQGAVPFQFVEFINSKRCGEWGVIFVDVDGRLIGNNQKDGFLRPMPIQSNQAYATYIFPNDSTYRGININFMARVGEKDEWLGIVSREAFGDYNPFEMKGLYEVLPEIVSADDSSIEIKLFTRYGALDQPIPVQGITDADLTLQNLTQSSSVTIDTVTEIAPGEYTISYATGVTVGDDLQLNLDKQGLSNDILGSTVIDTQ